MNRVSIPVAEIVEAVLAIIKTFDLAANERAERCPPPPSHSGRSFLYAQVAVRALQLSFSEIIATSTVGMEQEQAAQERQIERLATATFAVMQAGRRSSSLPS